MKTPQLSYYDMTPGAVAFSTTRLGGYGTGAYGEFNITHYCGDEPSTVTKNRAALCQLLGIADQALILPRQTHGTEVLRVDESLLTLPPHTRQERLEGIDALVTDLRDVCIGVSTADCIPVLVYDTRRHIAAAIHAGWRGTVARIVEKTIVRMAEWYGSQPEDMVAQTGPGISLPSFEVGDEVYEAFRDAGFQMTAIARRMARQKAGEPTSDGRHVAQHSDGEAGSNGAREMRWHIDLPECNRLQLLTCGIPQEAVSVSPVCTYLQPHRFFSARRLGIQSGRIFTAIMMK